MDTDDLAQQQALQKEFNELVMSLSQQVSDKHLLDTNKKIIKVSSEIAKNLASHATMLDEVSQKHADILNEVSKNHLFAINKGITSLNENIPSQLDSQGLALQSIEKHLFQHHNEISDTINNELVNHLITYKQQLNTEFAKITQFMETKFKINNAEVSELKINNHKISNELNHALNNKIDSVARTVLYAAIAVIICIALPLAFLIYSIVIR